MHQGKQTNSKKYMEQEWQRGSNRQGLSHQQTAGIAGKAATSTSLLKPGTELLLTSERTQQGLGTK